MAVYRNFCGIKQASLLLTHRNLACGCGNLTACNGAKTRRGRLRWRNVLRQFQEGKFSGAASSFGKVGTVDDRCLCKEIGEGCGTFAVNPLCPLHGDARYRTIPSLTGLTKRDPEMQHLPVAKRAPLPPEQQELHDRLVRHIDTSDIEQRLFDSYVGGFIGMAYEEEDETLSEPPKERLIVLTDEE